MGVDGDEQIRLIGRSDIGGIFLWRPGRLRVIHLLKVFRPEWSRRNKRVSNHLIPVLETIMLLAYINQPLHRIPEKIEVTKIPVSRDEEDLVDGCRPDRPLEERKKKPEDKNHLICNNLFISAGCWEGGE